MDFLLPENGHVDPDDGDYQSKDLAADRMVQHEPLLICNYELDVLSNERQFERIFSDHNFENVLDPRYCNVGICTQDLRKEKFCSKKVEQAPDFTNDVVPNVNNGSVGAGAGAGNLAPFTTGKGDPRFYFKAIDQEIWVSTFVLLGLLYFVLCSGGLETYYRFRNPMIPFMILLLAQGWGHILFANNETVTIDE